MSHGARHDQRYRRVLAVHTALASGGNVHARYARMRSSGVRAVREVVVAHPHPDLAISYPGYRALPFVPDQPIELPRSCDRQRSRPVVDPAPGPGGEPPPPQLGTGPAPVTVVADQYWMHEQLGSRRIDLRELAVEALSGREVERLVIALPSIPILAGFAAAAVQRGWQVVDAPVDRGPQIMAIADVVEEVPGTVVVVTADPPLLAELVRRGLSTERFDDLGSLPELWS